MSHSIPLQGSRPFDEAYEKLNKEQRAAVDAIDGPVMVVAGPGTGKTQILALRIANILRETDTPADGILCLTFTNSGVRAMQERLRTYIGPAASKVTVSTFHSFGMGLLEEFYAYLGLASAPRLIDDVQSVALCDEILRAGDWKHIRTRANPALYFRDITSLVSLVKRERITPLRFLAEVERDIESVKNDPEHISTRGPSKGRLKQDAERRIESLERTRELVAFYGRYEELKAERNLLDYDDVLESIVRLVEVSEDAREAIRVRYLYVLVDEHQDSSGVQNDFLSRVWGGLERPNLFVVGDDRQLIYGFGGASLEHFENFRTAFGPSRRFTLLDNYRSTQTILDSAETLLQSSLAEGRLVGKRSERAPGEDRKIRLVEADYPRDEIIAAGLAIKDRMGEALAHEAAYLEKDGKPVDPEDAFSLDGCAILVPKNAQVKSAMRVLADLGLPVASAGALRLFELPETQSFLRVLEVLANPFLPDRVAPTLLDPLSRIPPLVAHQFLAGTQPRKLTLAKLLEDQPRLDLFADDDARGNAVARWATRLWKWLDQSAHADLYGLVQAIGDELLVATAESHEELARRVEIVRTLLHLVLAQGERPAASAPGGTATAATDGPGTGLASFVAFVRRLEEYGTDVPLAVFAADRGVRVMTLHGSKGLEFDFVWIAHLDEKSLQGKRGGAFTLPESVASRVEEKDELVLKRQLYVAITRAKRFCTLSYARHGYTGGDQALSGVVLDLPEALFDRQTLAQSEDFIRQHDIRSYVTSDAPKDGGTTLADLAGMVAAEYGARKVSVTMLNNFFECPWKWYFRNMVQLPEAESVSLQFGNVVHAAIEGLLKGRTGPDPDAVSAAVRDAVSALRGLSPDDEEHLVRDALPVITCFAVERLPEIRSPHESERALSYRDPEFPHLTVTGKIDLMEALDDVRVRVTDFKTGSVKRVSEIGKEDEEGRMSGYLRQLAMYSYLLEGATRESREVAESVLEFVEAKPDDRNARFVTHVTGEQIEALRGDIRDYDRLLRTGEWVNRPCRAKSYPGQGDCPYCALAKIYKK